VFWTDLVKNFKSRDAVVIAIVGAAVTLLAFWGFSVCGTAACHTALPVDGIEERLYASFKLAFGFGAGGYALEKGDPVQLVFAQFTAYSYVAVYTSSAILIRNLRRDMRVALAQHKSDHTIVCGLGDMGMQVVQSLRDLDQDAVVIDVQAESSHVPTCERQGVPFLKGDAKNIQTLRLAGIARARTIVLCTGDDAENVEIALRIKDEVTRNPRKHSERLLVLVEMRTDWLFARLVDHGRGLGSDRVELRFFNGYDNTARLLMNRLIPRRDATGFAVIGFGAMGRELTLHVVRNSPIEFGATLNVTIFDRDAEHCERNLREAIPTLGEIAHLDFVAVDVQSDNPTAWQTVAGRLAGKSLLGVAVCIHDDDAGLYVALNIRDLLDRQGHRDVPVHVWLERHRYLGQLAASIEDRGAANDSRMRPFGSLEELLSPDILVADKLDILAKAVHENNRANLSPSQRGGDQDKPWEELAERFKMSSRRDADHIPIRLRLCGLDIEKSDTPELIEFRPAELKRIAQLYHQRYVIERRLLGWKYGKERNNAALLHPDVTTWEKLEPEARKGNIDRMRQLPKILADAGFEIVRVRDSGFALPS